MRFFEVWILPDLPYINHLYELEEPVKTEKLIKGKIKYPAQFRIADLGKVMYIRNCFRIQLEAKDEPDARNKAKIAMSKYYEDYIKKLDIEPEED